MAFNAFAFSDLFAYQDIVIFLLTPLNIYTVYIPTCRIGYISSEYHATKYWNTHKINRSLFKLHHRRPQTVAQIAHEISETSPKRRTHHPRQGGHTKKTLRTPNSILFGEKKCNVSGTKLHHRRPKQKTLAEIAPKKFAPWKINMVHLQITHWKKGKWSEPNLHCPTPGLSHFCSINPWRVCSRTALALWCLPPVATQR